MKRYLLALLLLVSPAVRAAISSSMIFEVRQAGNNANSGCFKEGATGTDLSQANSESYGFSNLVIDGTTNTKVTSASHNFVAADVGNCLRISSGTGFTTGVFEIVSVASNAATLDRSAGTLSSTGGVFHVGGALATLTQLNTDMCGGCRAWVKADATYTITAGVTFNYNANNAYTQVSGYTSARGDGGSFTVQISSGSSVVPITLQTGSNGSLYFRNAIIDANSQTDSRCMTISSINNYAENIECKNGSSTSTQILFNNVRVGCFRCYVHDVANAGAAFTFNNDDQICRGCIAGTLTGSAHAAFVMPRGQCFDCVVFGNAVAGSDGFQLTAGGPTTIDRCVIYNVARDGIRFTPSNGNVYISNCVISTVTNGINNTGTALRSGDIYDDYNFTYNASGSVVSGVTAGSHSMTLTADPFISASTKDFRLSNNGGGGALVRAKGYPQTLPGITGTFYPDPGVAQHQDPKFRFFF